VGAAIGWALDYWLRISPWGMIVFVLLGFAAGVLNVMRVAGVVPVNTLGTRDSKD
jgi:ATP synthase protein I